MILFVGCVLDWAGWNTERNSGVEQDNSRVRQPSLSIMYRSLVSVVLVCVTTRAVAHGALQLTYEQDVNGTPGITVFIVDGWKMRVERSVRSRPLRVTIYDDARIELTFVDVNNGTYKTLTQADLKKAEQAGISAPPDVRYERVGTKKKILGQTCEVYRVFIGARLRNEGCFAPWSPDLVSREEGQHFSRLKAQVERFRGIGAEEWSRVPGLVMEQHFFGADGKSVQLTMELKFIGHPSLPPRTFQLPPTAKPETTAAGIPAPRAP